MNDEHALHPLARLETARAGAWFIAAALQIGPHHVARAEPCQDSYRLGCHGSSFWMVLADGVGSQPLSGFGSSAATTAVDASLRLNLSSGLPPDAAMMTAAFADAHTVLTTETASRGLPIEAYATTLAAVCISGQAIVAAAVGDSGGAFYQRPYGEAGKGRMGGLVAPAQVGPGVTHSITDPAWRDYFAVQCHDAGGISGLVLTTDGAGDFYRDRTADGFVFDDRYFASLDEALTVLSPRGFVSYLTHYLSIAQPTNADDRTLLLAWRDGSPGAAASTSKPSISA